MSRLTNIQIPTDTWIVGTWEEYLQVLDSLSEQKTKSYYYCNHIRLEMSPVSNRPLAKVPDQLYSICRK